MSKSHFIPVRNLCQTFLFEINVNGSLDSRSKSVSNALNRPLIFFEINIKISLNSCSKSTPNLPVRNQCQWLIAFLFELSVKLVIVIVFSAHSIVI